MSFRFYIQNTSIQVAYFQVEQIQRILRQYICIKHTLVSKCFSHKKYVHDVYVGNIKMSIKFYAAILPWINIRIAWQFAKAFVHTETFYLLPAFAGKLCFLTINWHNEHLNQSIYSLRLSVLLWFQMLRSSINIPTRAVEYRITKKKHTQIVFYGTVALTYSDLIYSDWIYRLNLTIAFCVLGIVYLF